MMATQLAEPVEQQTDPNVNDNAEAPERDFETEARSHGWSPKDDFKGDPNRWVDAETFMKRADEMMPLLKADRDRIKRELDDLKKQVRRANDHFSKSEERAYQRALSELQGQLDTAVQNKDGQAAREISTEIGKLSKEAAAPKGQQVSQQDLNEAFADFREENSWYDRANMPNASEEAIEARLYADRMMEKHLSKTQDMGPAEFLTYIGGLVDEKFPELKGKPASRPKPNNPVSGGGTRAPQGKRGQTFNDLPVEAQRICDKWVKSGLIKSREDYVKSYEWN